MLVVLGFVIDPVGDQPAFVARGPVPSVVSLEVGTVRWLDLVSVREPAYAAEPSLWSRSLGGIRV